MHSTGFILCGGHLIFGGQIIKSYFAACQCLSICFADYLEVEYQERYRQISVIVLFFTSKTGLDSVRMQKLIHLKNETNTPSLPICLIVHPEFAH